ncbi:MAG: aspartate carbamoyltransferase regulatory subunit, partial [Clostridiales Family XIII bacterium]|nr:aspartate carbamoyltransferase regulatory subunit [Clostridiales Family XIII bacterium]
MLVNSIENGIVIDHLSPGSGLKILEYLGADRSNNTVVLLMNAQSGKHAKKDIIKIENLEDVDLSALGLLDHSATVNIIKDGVITEKIKLSLPEKVVGVIKCKNPRCVTSVEPSLSQVFYLVDSETEEYR